MGTEKRNESESDPLEAAASASSALGGDNAAIGDGSEGSENPDGQSGKKKKNRCFSCKKKVGLTGFTCRCGGLFCSINRYSDKHDCSFDYKVTTTFVIVYTYTDLQMGPKSQ